MVITKIHVNVIFQLTKTTHCWLIIVLRSRYGSIEIRYNLK